jgi:hypothetical protein
MLCPSEVISFIHGDSTCMKKKRILYVTDHFLRFILVLDVDEEGNVLQPEINVFYMNR